MKKCSVILLAGGVGARMGTSMPKQFLQINNKIIARYSFDLLTDMPEIAEIIVVCAPPYRHLFETSQTKVAIKFALPGERRQDSVYHGFQLVSSHTELVVIHDAARPLISVEIVRRVAEAAHRYGAATAGVPVKFTIKESDGVSFVKKTPDRSRLWEIQTPQALKPDLLKQGFKKATEDGVTVTDDVALAELLQHKVKIVQGCYTNLKVTTPDDLILTQQLLNARKETSVAKG
jgi:2-C-methyl-D-erythritol 4-phosphate cytidylyltransferase